VVLVLSSGRRGIPDDRPSELRGLMPELYRHIQPGPDEYTRPSLSLAFRLVPANTPQPNVGRFGV